VELGDPRNIGGVEALGTLLTFKLDGFAFGQSLITFCLNGGEMDKDIFTTRALNESEPLGSVEPLDDALFPHAHSPSILNGAIGKHCALIRAIRTRRGAMVRLQKHREPPARPETVRDGSSMTCLSCDCS